MANILTDNMGVPAEDTTKHMTAKEAGEQLAAAAQAAIEGKAQVDIGKAKGASAFAVMVAGFSSDEVAERKWTVDIEGKAGDVHHHARCTGINEFGNDTLAWKLNGEGKVSKVAQTAYKTKLQYEFFNLSESVAAVWTAASRAIPIAQAIREEGMQAEVINGNLKLTGGTTDRAKAMSLAKTVTAMKKAVEGTTGTNRATTGNAKSGTVEDSRISTPNEITLATVALVKLIAKGETLEPQNVLGNIREIVRLFNSNPEAFAED